MALTLPLETRFAPEITFRKPPMTLKLASVNHFWPWNYLQKAAYDPEITFRKPHMTLKLPSKAAYDPAITYRKPHMTLKSPSESRLWPEVSSESRIWTWNYLQKAHFGAYVGVAMQLTPPPPAT
jgi:hypothetical protein